MRTAAGMFLAAAAVTAASVLGAGPATALTAAAAVTPPRAIERVPAPASAAAPQRKRDMATAAAERMAGIRAEMDQAVAWGEVTREQADRFVAQLASRLAAGG